MLFNSLTFVIFLLIITAAYWSIRSFRLQNYLLLAGSLFFYGYSDVKFLGLILLCSLAGYTASLLITHNPKSKKVILIVAVFFLAGTLFVFKYYNFFIDSFAIVLGVIGLSAQKSSLALIVPLGISFYIFQILSYLIDVYRNKFTAESNFFLFLLYITFFPQLINGPLERAHDLLPQFKKKRDLSWEGTHLGLFLILQGFLKKVVIADNLAPIVNLLFKYDNLPAPLIVVGVLAFTFQIYGDFAGYSDIARGTARLMGFKVSINFLHPYFSRNPSEFWKRWHITLSKWIRDYLYISLGGNRLGSRRTYVNLIIAMALCGLWHGAAWNYVIWGVYHGLLLIIYRFYIEHFSSNSVGRFVSNRVVTTILMFICVAYGWLLFRIENIDQLLQYHISFFTNWSMANIGWLLLVDISPFVLIALLLDTTDRVFLDKAMQNVKIGWFLSLFYLVSLMLIVLFVPEHSGNFIYFKF